VKQAARNLYIKKNTTMTEENRQFENKEENVVSDLFDDYSETQRELLIIESKKVRNKLFAISVIFFISVLITLGISGMPIRYALFDLLLFPAIIFGLGFLAMKEPLVAVSIAAVIVIGLWVLQIVLVGGEAAIRGFLVKGIIIYMLIAGFQSGKEAHRIRKELNSR
jgi:uncharacterized membrane protein